MSDLRRDVGRRIRESREGRDQLQRDLAKAAGVPVRTLGRIERGEVDVRLSTLSRIARALELPLAELVK